MILTADHCGRHSGNSSSRTVAGLAKQKGTLQGLGKLGCWLGVYGHPGDQTNQFLIKIGPKSAWKPMDFDKDSVHGLLMIEGQSNALRCDTDGSCLRCKPFVGFLFLRRVFSFHKTSGGSGLV